MLTNFIGGQTEFVDTNLYFKNEFLYTRSSCVNYSFRFRVFKLEEDVYKY